MTEFKQLPAHDFHSRNGARFAAFAGWNMPVQYGGILAEHLAVRRAAGLFDVSHMGEFEVDGPQAAEFLDRLLVNDIGGTAPGRAVYSPMCAEDGGTLEDLIVYRLDAGRFLVCVNAANAAGDLDWFNGRLSDWRLDAQVHDRSDDYALFAVQGPGACTILERAGIALPGGRFRHHETECSGRRLRVCRTGYTGEDGAELFCAADDATAVAEHLLQAGADDGLQLCGLGARDSLRLEAGFPLYGHELQRDISPLEAGLGWTVKFEKDAFVGRQPLLRQKESGTPRKVVHFILEGRRIAREGSPVLSDGERVGRILSGSLSPVLEAPIGSALIDSAAGTGDLSVDLRGHPTSLEVTRPPLHRKGVRAT